MQTVILACNTIRDELEKAAVSTSCPYPVVWVESGLHTVTESLRRRLQEELDRMKGVGKVILAFGLCGNAVAGLKTGDYQLIIPRVDDCITLLLGSQRQQKELYRAGRRIFPHKRLDGRRAKHLEAIPGDRGPFRSGADRAYL